MHSGALFVCKVDSTDVLRNPSKEWSVVVFPDPVGLPTAVNERPQQVEAEEAAKSCLRLPVYSETYRSGI